MKAVSVTVLRALVLLVVVAGCGSAPSGGTASTGSPSKPAAVSEAGAPAVRDTAAACSARIRLNSNLPPGIDPTDPDPAPQQMMDWAASATADFELLAANIPVELAPQVATQRADLERARKGIRIDVLDPAGATSSNAIDKFVFDQCGLQRLEVVGNGDEYGPVPTALNAGPLAIKFSTMGSKSPSAFVLLVARIKDGTALSVQDLTSNRPDVDSALDVLAGVLPSDGEPGYGTAELKSGHYALQSPLGTPPTFADHNIAAEFTVP